MTVIAEIDFTELGAFLQHEADQYERLDFRKPLKVCAFLLAGQMKAGFVKSRAPDGTPWKPLKRPRIKGTRNKGGKLARKRSSTTSQPLWDTGRLVASMGAGADHVQTITSSELIFGTNVSYAPFHQFGTKHIPARPFLGISSETMTQIESVFRAFLAENVLS